MKSLAMAVMFIGMILCSGCAVLVEEQPPPPSQSDHKVAVCHKGKKTLYVDENAVKAHLGHGDYLGPCY